MDGQTTGLRERFLRRLQAFDLDMGSLGGFAGYWEGVAAEAQRSEDAGKLDGWLKALRRDRAAVDRLKAKKETSTDEADVQLINELLRLLALLDDVERRLRGRLHHVRNALGMWIFLAGPGTKSKPAPKGVGGEPTAKDKEANKSKRGKEAALAKKKSKAKPSRTKAG